MRKILHTTCILLLSQTCLANNVIEQPSKQALQGAMQAYQFARKQDKVENNTYMSIVDFSQPSYQPRFFIYDLKTHKAIFSSLVAQGKGSGRGAYATNFSNTANSDMSSLGTYITVGTYVGKHKRAIRLSGLQPGINSNAEKRGIVIHQAWYVNPAFAAQYHRVGNSWGCFTLSPRAMKKALNTIANGSVLYAYDKNITNIV